MKDVVALDRNILEMNQVMSEHISGVTGEHHLFGYDYQTQNWEETADTYLKLVYDGWTLDTPGNPAGAGFGQGCGHPGGPKPS